VAAAEGQEGEREEGRASCSGPCESRKDLSSPWEVRAMEGHGQGWDLTDCSQLPSGGFEENSP
jgi:hypothetical protein